MKPSIDAAYDAFISKQQQQRIEREVPDRTQASQWQQYSPVENTASKEWNLQDALRGVIGVGNQMETTPYSVNHYPKTNYPSPSLHNQSDSFSYQAQRLPDLPLKIFEHQQQTDVPPKVLERLPTLPPKIPITNQGPELPPKIKLYEEEKKARIGGPTVDASTERGEPLRQMILPKAIQSRFLSIAEPNTRKKIETCGILAGTLKNNILKITTLIIPKQTGTSDTCTTENEEELFDIQDKYDLLTFGWIHTHPTQSCFLSSVDLHTHCSYQLMLPEAIAIVCAPTQKPNFGIFRLTDPPGLDVISNCKRQPAFHPHPDLPIYTSAGDGGHVRISDYDFEILDLRK
ncbi:MAG: hypothetical protein EXX96DRAFT_591839 [Benjaminiella poitrasii]|nr:MAG: hypothetical protein EXX96DRAFT_591839 [Benjaminiella poitrasii]